MSSLLDFPRPSIYSSIGEKNSKVIESKTSQNNVLDYKHIDCKDITSERKTLACLESTCKPAFVNLEEHLLDKIQIRWNKDGLLGVFEELTSSEEVHPHLRTLSQRLYNGLSLIKKPKDGDAKSPALKVQMVCHPHIPRLAVTQKKSKQQVACEQDGVPQEKGSKDNSVKIISLSSIMGNDQDILLKDKRIDHVSCLAWRPKAAMSLAVGSSGGILVWLLDPSVASTRPGSNMTRFLQSKDIVQDISSVSWSNDGKLLACSCVNSTTFWIWDIISQTNTPLHRVGNTTSFVDWSPCGQRLLTTNSNSIFRVWETATWKCEKWSELNGKCTNACWSSCGSYLLFTVENEALIYYVHFQNNKGSDDVDISGSGVALKCADVTKCMFDASVKEVGGLISGMAWDPTNSRLVVTFQGDNDNNQPHIALYHTKISPFLQLIPCGFLCGDVNTTPICMDFIHGYNKGALLSVYWSDDTVSLVPLLFNKDLTQTNHEKILLPDNQGAMEFNQTLTDVTDINNLQNETTLYSTFNE